MKFVLSYVAYTAAVLVILYSIVMTLNHKNHLFHGSAVYTSIRNTTYGVVPISFEIIRQPLAFWVLFIYRINIVKNKNLYQDIQTIVTGKQPPTLSPAVSNYNPFQSSSNSGDSNGSGQSVKTDGVYQLVLATSEDTVLFLDRIHSSFHLFQK